MKEPPHPGAIIRQFYLSNSDCSERELARHLNVAFGTIGRVLNEKAAISPVMAHRLASVLGTSAEFWMMMQAMYDLWHTKDSFKYDELKRLND